MNFIINRKVFISMLFIGLSMLGVFSYKNLPVELIPNAEEPVFYINIMSVSEVAPEYMEKQAIVPIEGAVGTLENIEQIESLAMAGRGSITLTYNKSTDIKYAYLELLEKIETIKKDLPAEFNVQVSKSDLEMLNSLFIALQVRGEGGVNRVRDLVDREIKTELENIDGIASAQVFGGREPTIEIVLKEEIAEAYDISPSTIRSLLSQNNQSRDFAGLIKDGNQRQFVNISAEYRNISDIQHLVIREQGPVLLGDVADVYFGVKEETSISRVNGKDAVTIQLIRDSQVNMIDLSHKTLAVINRLNEQFNPQDLEIVVQMNMAEIMEKNIDQIMQLAIEGGILAIFVLWMFLRNIRLVLAIGLSIPISVYTAFNFFYAYDISINSLTLVGMALAIGMLVDNSVVVLENIYRHAGLGKNKALAVVEGTSEIKRSIFAATLTTVSIFLPFVFSDNLYVKLIGNHIGVSIISTLLVSLFVALLLIPMLSYVFMKGQQVEAFKKVSIHNKLIRFYIVVLKASIRKPATTVVGALVIFFATILIGLLLSVATNREVETNNLNISITMEGGSTLEMADELVKSVEEKIARIEEVEDVSSNFNEEEASLQVKLKEDFQDIDDREIAEIKADIIKRTQTDKASLSVGNSTDMGSEGAGGNGRRGNRGAGGFQSFLGIGAQIETIKIKGQDFNEMRRVAEDIKFYLEELSTVQSANLSVSDNRPEVHMQFDQKLMSQYGLSLNDVSAELSGFQPEFNSGIKFYNGLEEYDITIKNNNEADPEESRNLHELKVLDIKSSLGSSHELQEISNIYLSSGMWGISRLNQEKELEVSYSFYQEYNESSSLLEGAKAEVEQMLSVISIPSGIAVEQVVKEDELAEFKFLIAAAAILIFMILASIFESFVTPFVLMFSIPLATIGSFFALILTGNSIMNPNSLTGLLILLGVVVNNSIILIDYSNILRRRGYNRVRAIMTAGISRVRPILITAITTIVAMFPLAMGQMEYVAVIGAPFAITVIGGLALSTVLTLVFIPTLNLGLENALSWIRGLNWKVQVIMFISVAFFTVIIWNNIDALVWQSIFFTVTIIGVPALAYIILKSMQQASEEIIPRNQDIIIRIENLVKIYGRESRIKRDYIGGKIRSSKVGEFLRFDKWGDFAILIYEIPMATFLFYFTYGYLDSGFWIFPFSLASYIYIIRIIDYIGRLRKLWWNSPYLNKMGKLFFYILFWSLPFGAAAQWYFSWDNLAGPIIILIFWLFALAINNAARNLKGEDINVERIRNVYKRNFYKLVYKIPLIGKKKEPFKALKGVSLEIGKGMFGLLGPNGAGKTTLMRNICGIFEQSYGKIWFNEFDTTEKREELQGLIGYLPQEFGMYENMSPWEYLQYQSILKGIVDKKIREERIKSVLESVNMYEKRSDKIGSFSGGMKQRIGIAQILLHLPRVLVVDEPTAGLDPRERIRFRNLLVELSRERIVIFSTHIIEDIASSCKTVAVLNKGELKYTGTPSEMATIAEGKVWQFNVNPDEFESIEHRLKVVHHMKEGETIRVRCLAEKKPSIDAIPVKPILEDSYLWLMRDSGLVLSKLEG